MEPEKLYSVPDAAKFLGGISKWTVHSWLSQGRLQRVKIGSRTMIRESELLKFVEDGSKQPASAPANLADSSAPESPTENGKGR